MTVHTDNSILGVSKLAKVIPWDRLQLDVTIKEFTEAECRDIMIRTYPNAKDYKLYVMSRCVYDFVKILKHIRLYSEHYSIDHDTLLEELFTLTMKVNPLLTTKFKQAGHAQTEACELEEKKER